MSSSATVSAPAPTIGRGATFPRVVASEWTKLTSLRSTSWIAAATIAASAGLTYLDANASSVDPGFRPSGSLTTGLLLAQVGPLILGVLVGTGEFSTGTARATFTAVPRRLPVLAAQTVVTGAFALLTSLLAVAGTVLGLVPAARSRGIPLGLATDGTPQVLVGMVLFLVGTALLGLAIGALVRRPVPAVAAAVVLVLILPVGLMLGSEVGGDPLAASVSETVPPSQAAVNTMITFLPSGAGSLLTTTSASAGVEGAPDIGPWGGGLVLAAWILVPLVAAAARLRTRDVS